MTDPFTSAAATNSAASAGVAAYKIFAYLLGPILAAIVVMFMSQPKSTREWFCAIISTVLCSMSLGAYLVVHYIPIGTLPDEMAAQIIGGVYFLAGLPGWFLVRVIFYTQARFAGKDALDIIAEAGELRNRVRRGDDP